MKDIIATAPAMEGAGRDDEPRPKGRVITGRFRRVRRGPRTTLTTAPARPRREPVRRPARIAVLLATAHRLQAMIDRGEVADRVELARRLGLTKTRVTQILDLTLLAPDIQEDLLFAEAVDGREPTSERALRALTRIPAWAEQRRVWERTKRGA